MRAIVAGQTCIPPFLSHAHPSLTSLGRHGSLFNKTSTMTNPQADAMIESGRPLKEIVLLFPNKAVAYEYFGRSMTHQFALRDSNCAICGRDRDTSTYCFTWRANIHTTKTVFLSFLFTALALFAAHLYSRWVVVEFSTSHRLCQQCQRHHRSRGVIVGIFHKLLFAILMLLLFLTVPLVVFLFAAPFIAPEGIWRMLAGALVGIGLLALVVFGFERCRRSMIPKPLRQIGRFPFFLYAVRKTA
jgi:hypothetical protein